MADILRDRIGDPEVILNNIGFMDSNEMSVSALRVPTRFLKRRSRATGIKVEAFLEENPELRECMVADGVSFDSDDTKTGNDLTPLAHIDRYTNLGDLMAYCVASDVPGRFLESLASVFPELPLLSSAMLTHSSFDCESDKNSAVGKYGKLRSGDDMTSVELSVSDVAHQGSGTEVKVTVNQAEVDSVEMVSIEQDLGKAGEASDVVIDSCQLGHHGDATGGGITENAHVIAAQQAEISIIESRSRASRKRRADEISSTGQPVCASPRQVRHLLGAYGGQPDSIPRYVTIARDSPPGSDDQFIENEHTEEQWDYSDVQGFNSNDRPKKSTSMPKIELYSREEFYGNSNEFPRSETIDFYIYDDDNDKNELSSSTCDNPDLRYYNNNRITHTETFV